MRSPPAKGQQHGPTSVMLCPSNQVWHLLRAPPEPPTPLPPEDRRQSVSRQPSFTYSEWMEEKVEDDFLDLDPVPETPVFDCTMDIKPEADPASLTVKSMGLQERWEAWRRGGLSGQKGRCLTLNPQCPGPS